MLTGVKSSTSYKVKDIKYQQVNIAAVKNTERQTNATYKVIQIILKIYASSKINDQENVWWFLGIISEQDKKKTLQIEHKILLLQLSINPYNTINPTEDSP